MNGLNKNEFKVSLLIGVSYLLFFNATVFISEDYNVKTYFSLLLKINWGSLFTISTSLLLIFWILPLWRKRKNNNQYFILASLGWLLIVTLGLSAWFALGSTIGIIDKPENFFNKLNIIRYFFRQLNGISYFAAIKFIYDSHRLQIENKDLLIERKTAELNFLQAQTNPHFLFNTLNNIYALSRLKSEKAPVSVLRLSKILRYMLNENELEFVDIEKEINIIHEYIELEKLRYDKSLSVKFDVTAENLNQKIPRLLIMPLIENAFKHGASETKCNPYVHIKLSINHSILSLEVENSTGNQFETDTSNEGIGLKNLKRQLELRFQDYHLDVAHKTGLNKLFQEQQVVDYEITRNSNNSYFYSLLVINLKSHAKN